MKYLKSLFLGILVILCSQHLAFTGGGPENVLIVVNQDSWASKYIANEYAELRNIPSTNIDKYRLSSLMTNHNEDLYFLQKLYYTHENFFHIIQAAGIIDSNEHEIHLFIIGKDIEQIRQEKSSITMTSPIGQTKTFILWTHTKEEVENGLKNKEIYFIEKIKQSEPIWSDGEVNLFDFKKKLE